VKNVEDLQIVSDLARPTEYLWQMALGVVAYLSSTRTVGLTLGGEHEKPLEGWVDADWAGCQETRRSTTGWVIELNNSPIVWSSRRQATVLASTTEAEYIAITEAGREIMWLRELLETIGYSQSTTILRCDNQGAITLTKKPSSHPRTKHIAIRHHQIREWTEQGMIRLHSSSCAKCRTFMPAEQIQRQQESAQGAVAARQRQEDHDRIGRWPAPGRVQGCTCLARRRRAGLEQGNEYAGMNSSI
jgi:hypothetical protein